VFARLLWLGLLASLIILMLNDPSELDIEPTHVFAAAAALVGLAFLSGSLALLVGASTGRRILATTAGAGVAVLGYVLNAIANQLEDTDGIRAVSPYSWAYQDQPLTDGADWVGLGALWGLSVLLVAATGMVLRARDITG
jgi:ABC-2 type transport system permease protein